MLPDYRLIAITAPELHPGLDLPTACRAAAAGGVTSIQIRLKHASASELLRATEQVISAVDVPVYVNDRLDVALTAGSVGVHLGADDLPPDRIRTLAPRPLRLGVSVGTEAEAAEASMADAHYWSVGPFYRTQIKSDAGDPLSIEGFRRLAGLSPNGVPVVAIGGIGAKEIPEVLRAGAAGVAVITGVFGVGDIERAATRIRLALDRGA